MEMDERQKDALNFLKRATRNWGKMPKLSLADLTDVADELQRRDAALVAKMNEQVLVIGDLGNVLNDLPATHNAREILKSLPPQPVRRG